MKNKQTNPSLCFECSNCLCDWMISGTPVKGWEAEKNEIFVKTRKSKRHIVSYRVIKCPEFKKVSGNCYKLLSNIDECKKIANQIVKSAIREYVTDRCLCNKFPNDKKYNENLEKSRKWFFSEYAELLYSGADGLPKKLDRIIGKATDPKELYIGYERSVKNANR